MLGGFFARSKKKLPKVPGANGKLEEVHGPECAPALGVIEACLGDQPSVLGLKEEVWYSRVQFMILTYQMFALLLQPDRDLADEEIAQFRRLSFKW
eukprot:CAMPEP_0201510178 /NCGR_PEP_ID=MMETSP0161_2-20130828/2982_1 /ASSEMBLY_ACC=CAM_ASM_000251 /TAXON_ID=180227 /ORGANISM="Neoparamoeba aestuarina, Strain SoJaBio B1-5/56/2" /LENGTH=95 /DNA_ID=CAMNT_0047905319 /DNA_START=1 /DNA_END=285 /DNA_ORIENTATION=-